MIFQEHESTPPTEDSEDDGHQYSNGYLTSLQPLTILLKDGETTATMYPIRANSDLLPLGLLAFLLDEFNMEIEKGDSFPYYEPLDLDEFKKMWFHKHGIVCVMVLGEIPELDYSSMLNEEYSQLQIDRLRQQGVITARNTTPYLKRKLHRNLNLNIQWEKQCLGTFNLIPAYPGRSSHVVTGAFLVNAGIRGKGIGRTLVESFLEWAPQLGFTSCCFPLVYGINVGIRRILESLNFRRIGKLPESGILKGYDSPIDAFIYGKEFTHVSKQIDAVNSARYDIIKGKYERLKFYLETSEYPASCNRNEKARLRAMSKTHSILNGKLMFKDREVIYEPQKQLEIAFETHSVEHLGINKVTSRVAERYHWKGIKQSVAQVIGTCLKCQSNTGNPNSAIAKEGIIVDATDPGNQRQILVSHNNEKHYNGLTKNTFDALETEKYAEIDLERYKQHISSDEGGPSVKLYKTEGQIRRIKFGLETGKKLKITKNTTNNNQSINSLKSYVQEIERSTNNKRPKYSEISPEILSSEPCRPGSDSETVLLEENTPSIVDEALLNLEDNVVATVCTVHKDQLRERVQNTELDEAIDKNHSEKEDPAFGPNDTVYY